MGRGLGRVDSAGEPPIERERDLAWQARFRARDQFLDIAVVAARAATCFLRVVRDILWVTVLTALALAALPDGWCSIARHGESWGGPRADGAHATPCLGGEGEDGILAEKPQTFLHIVEGIMAEEQRINGQKRGDGCPPAPREPAAVGRGDAAISDDKQGHGRG
jgi:hypothetical protein